MADLTWCHDESVDVLGTATIDIDTVPLSPDQHVMIVAMYESYLRLGRIEGNTTLADRLGWSVKKYNRKLDAVCGKLHRLGVEGTKGSADRQADGRREALLSYAVTTGLVGPNDVDLLRGRRGEPGAIPSAA
jgi:hypothetical protein